MATPMRVRIFKQHQRFSSAHFTMYTDGTSERMHGHNYTMEASFHSTSEHLNTGILVPFDVLKTTLKKMCDRLHERVLMPSKSPYLTVAENGDNYEFTLNMEKMPRKFYSIPKEDVVLLPCDNVSCENMAYTTLHQLIDELPESIRKVTTKISLTMSEGPGSEVSVEASLDN
eukprot:TRINITY_DN6312_c0_g9_i1.p4 TRINITY_DN6312_c0_g9~~TRINITY_DN6312_c0_g9_i1.p4  ORF type:complete len:172 (+),score=73.05 TRINITY_DN6312_c0_g9_i1:59-574(+)